jgi:hypothetical protein
MSEFELGIADKRISCSLNAFEIRLSKVLILRNAPEQTLLKARLDLRLKELIQSTCGDIFPPRVFLAQSNAPRLGSIIKI